MVPDLPIPGLATGQECGKKYGENLPVELKREGCHEFELGPWQAKAIGKPSNELEILYIEVRKIVVKGTKEVEILKDCSCIFYFQVRSVYSENMHSFSSGFPNKLIYQLMVPES